MPVNPDKAQATASLPEPVWSQARCAQCGRTSGQAILVVPHPDAPDGISHILQCDGCGLRRLDPRPNPEPLSRYYAQATGYNAFAGRRRSPRAQAIWEFLRDGFSRPANLPWLTRLVAPLTAGLADWLFDINIPIHGRTHLRVLEVGSGYGDILIYLKSRGCSVLGTDLSASGAAKAADYGVEVRVGNLADLKLPAQSFDAVILCHCLEHVPDPNAELAELHRLLAPGGQLHIAVPNGSATRLVTDGVEWMHLSHPFHFWFFDPENLVALVRRHGFEPIAPPVTTTRHHAWGLWRSEVFSTGLIPATRRLLRYLRGSIGNPQGGDVLRLVSRRV